MSDCQNVNNINGSEAQCLFVQTNENCQDSDGYLNYVEILYCDFNSQPYEALAIFAFWLVVLFIGLAVSADDYFCPNLATISKTLRLSENIAGVTIMAFGNGAPDIFSALASVKQQRPELLLGGLFGAGIFVTTCVAGAVCIAQPFHLMERPFLRDVIFYIASGFWAFCIFYRQEIRLWDSIGFLSLYLVYILVVIFGRIIHQYMRKRALQVQQEDQEQIISNEVQPAIEDQKEPDENSIQETEPEYVSWVQPGSISGSSDQMDSVSVQMPNGPWSRLIHFLNPFKEWSQKNCLGKFWLIIKSPVILILNMTIPVVDQDQDQKGWCQYLHAFQLSLSGFMICLFTKEMSLEILDIKFWQLALIISLLVTILLLMTSSNSNPPKLQPLLAYFGFVISVGWIYLIANEIVSILKALGVYFGLSDAILGLTVLAWGNSIGDLVADVSMAKQGSPRMGFSACFGGPLFNLLLGIGLPFTISLATTDSNVLPVQYDQMILVLCAGLGVALVTNLFLFPFTKFKGTKIHGLILVVLYIAFMTVAIYFEFKYEE